MFPAVGPQHAGVYKSVIANKLGKAACYAHLYVTGEASILSNSCVHWHQLRASLGKGCPTPEGEPGLVPVPVAEPQASKGW